MVETLETPVGGRPLRWYLLNQYQSLSLSYLPSQLGFFHHDPFSIFLLSHRVYSLGSRSLVIPSIPRLRRSWLGTDCSWCSVQRCYKLESRKFDCIRQSAGAKPLARWFQCSTLKPGRIWHKNPAGYPKRLRSPVWWEWWGNKYCSSELSESSTYFLSQRSSSIRPQRCDSMVYRARGAGVR